MSEPASPFVGLSAFSAATAAYFTGRERFALTLAGALLQSRVTVLFGQSGSGKSSVLGAALPDALRAITAPKRRAALRGRQRVVEGAAAPVDAEAPDPPRAPFRLLAFNRWHPGFEAVMFHDVAAALEAPPAAPLHQALTGWALRERAPLVLVLDQFEEFFLYQARPAEHPLVRELALIAAEHEADLHVLISLREDSLAQLDRLRAVIPDILAVTVPLRPLDIRAAEEAIRKPVAVWSAQKGVAITVEDALVDRLIEQVTARESAAAKAEASALPLVELPLLQLALERIWQASIHAEGFMLGAATLDRLGGAAGIVRAHLESTISALTPAQRALVPKLFRFLVTAGGGKLAWRAEDLADELQREAEAEMQARAAASGQEAGRGPDAAAPRAAGTAEVAATLQALASGRARILRTQPDPRGGPPLYELFHDALAEPALKVARDALVAEAQARLAKERRRRRVVALIAGSVLIVMAGLTGHSWVRSNQAREATAQAEMQKTRAIATLARQASERGDHMKAILAALEVLPDPDAMPPQDRPVSSAAVAVLLQAWWQNPEKLALIGHTDAVWHAAFSPDGQRVATASLDGTARAWDLAGDVRNASVLRGHEDRVWHVAFSLDGQRVVTASDDRTARVWVLAGDLTAPQVLQGHGASVRYAAFSPDGQRVLTASDDGTARVWDLSGDPSAPLELKGHGGPVNHAAFSPDGLRVLTASADHTARVWDLAGDLAAPLVLQGHIDKVWHAAFSPDGQHVVTASQDRTALVWSLAGDLERPSVLHGHRDVVLHAAFSPDGKHVLTASMDRTAGVWDLAGNLQRPRLQGHTGPVMHAAFSPDGQRVVTASFDGTSRVWDLVGEISAPRMLRGHDGMVHHAAFSPDGRRVVTASGDGTARVFWDLAGDLSASGVLKGHGGPVLRVAFSPDGRRVVTASADRTARVWDLVADLSLLHVLRGHGDKVNHAAFSPDGQRVVTASDDGTARVWDLAGDTSAPRELKGHGGPVLHAAFSPDGQRVVTAGVDTMALVWDLASDLSLAQALRGHRDSVRHAAFSPDGQRVVTASDDRTARVWDLAGDFERPCELQGQTDRVGHAEFDPGGQRVVTASDDGTVRVWDLACTPPVWAELRSDLGVLGVMFAPDGRRLLTLSGAMTVQTWPLPDPNALVRIAKAALTRGLTVAERDEFGLAIPPDPPADRNTIPPPPR